MTKINKLIVCTRSIPTYYFSSSSSIITYCYGFSKPPNECDLPQVQCARNKTFKC